MADKKKKVGRPPVEIDRKQFTTLCEMMCTLEEIAGFFDCSQDTIERWCKRTFDENFADVYKRFSAKGRISLRRKQFRLADKNAGMAIFLGKNYLGQTDRINDNSTEEVIAAMANILKTIEVVSGAAEADA